MDYPAARRQKLRRLIKKHSIDALLVTNYTNVTYLTGFTGDDSYLLVTASDEVILSDARYTTQLEDECPGLKLNIRGPGVGMIEAIGRVAKSAKVKSMGYESDSMTVGLKEQIESKLSNVQLSGTTGVVEELRLIKDREEIALLREAVRYAEKGFEVLRATLRGDLTEKQVASDLEHQLRGLGAKGCSFPPIVAVGSNAALPHATPTDRRIEESTFVLVDWGADGGLYKSDLTRVLATGKIPPKLERIYRVVLKAQLKAIDAIKPGVMCHDVDRVARSLIEKAGFGKHFGHGLGHGIGLDIHEGPRLTTNAKQELKPGMVVTVEPGIYLPGFGGVRIEDDVLVTKSGHEVLTSVPKELAEIYVN